MPLQFDGSGVTIGQSVFPFYEFEGFVRNHLKVNPDTRYIEQEAAELHEADFEELSLKRFIRRVCNWGGYPGIGGRVLNRNSAASLQTHFREAVKKLEAEFPNVADALREINHVHQLGSPSFASKHLRFLRPDLCPILDSIISGRLRYRSNPQGYAQLSHDCLEIAALLEQYSIFNPMERPDGRWFAADVEMAVFARINNLCS